MKMSKKLIALGLSALMLIAVCGCDMAVLNKEKDAKSTVATIDGTDYLKGDFLNFYNFYLFLYDSYGYTLPSTDSDIENLKESVFDSWVDCLIKKSECAAAGTAVDAEEITAAVDEFIAQAKTTAKTDEDYAKLLSDYGYTADTVAEGIKPSLELIQYGNFYMTPEAKTDFSELGKMTAGTVGSDKTISMADLYFYVLAQEAMISSYSSSESLPQTPAALTQFYDDCFDYLADGVKALCYCEEKGVEITDEDIAEAMSSFDMLATYYGEDYFVNLARSFYLNAEQYSAAREFCGRAAAAQAKLDDEYLATLTITDEALRTFFEENIAEFDSESTVSAYHILTEDEEFANQLKAEAGDTAEGFMAVYEKYKDNEKVKEATDLGAFTRSDMVTEFMQCAFGLSVGGIGSCKTTHGYHLVYVYDKDDKGVTYENSAEHVREDYEKDQLDDGGRDYFTTATSSYSVKAEEYNIVPADLAEKYFYEKHGVKTNMKAVLR